MTTPSLLSVCSRIPEFLDSNEPIFGQKVKLQERNISIQVTCHDRTVSPQFQPVVADSTEVFAPKFRVNSSQRLAGKMAQIAARSDGPLISVLLDDDWDLRNIPPAGR